MTNLKCIVVSTGTYELWETDQPGVLIFVRRDSCDIMNRDVSRVSELYGTYLQRLAEENPGQVSSVTDYSMSIEPDQKSIKIVQSSVFERNNVYESNKEDESDCPSVEEVMATLERKTRKKKTIKAWLKSIFRL